MDYRTSTLLSNPTTADIPAHLWANDPLVRLATARTLSERAQAATTRRLVSTAPIRPWPYGMPTVANPWVVVLGVSPGDSPAAGDRMLDTTGARYAPPTFGIAHPGFSYRDARHYWDKVRVLCAAVLRAQSPTLTERDCLALSGHLNLGTGRNGRGTTAATDPVLATWVADLLGTQLRPRVVIGVGLGSIIADTNFRRAWERGSLPICWGAPDVQEPLALLSGRER